VQLLGYVHNILNFNKCFSNEKCLLTLSKFQIHRLSYACRILKCEEGLKYKSVKMSYAFFWVTHWCLKFICQQEVYIQWSVQHNLFYYVFKEATYFSFHKAILRPPIDLPLVVYYNARINGIPYTFNNICWEDTKLKIKLKLFNFLSPQYILLKAYGIPFMRAL
jgi:hypothetical protein